MAGGGVTSPSGGAQGQPETNHNFRKRSHCLGDAWSPKQRNWDSHYRNHRNWTSFGVEEGHKNGALLRPFCWRATLTLSLDHFVDCVNAIGCPQKRTIQMYAPLPLYFLRATCTDPFTGRHFLKIESSARFARKSESRAKDIDKDKRTKRVRAQRPTEAGGSMCCWFCFSLRTRKSAEQLASCGTGLRADRWFHLRKIRGVSKDQNQM